MGKKYEVVFINNEIDDYILYSNKDTCWIGERSDNEGYFNQEFTLEEVMKFNPSFIRLLKRFQNDWIRKYMQRGDWFRSLS